MSNGKGAVVVPNEAELQRIISSARGEWVDVEQATE